MIDEDFTAAKLKGHNCLIKFKDGEELTTIADYALVGDEGDWFENAEKFLNSIPDVHGDPDILFPMPGFAFCRETIKYVRKI